MKLNAINMKRVFRRLGQFLYDCIAATGAVWVGENPKEVFNHDLH